MATISANICIRRDTAANWTSNDPTMLVGEMGYETDTGKFKVGTGTTWTATNYSGGVTAPGLGAIYRTVDSKLADTVSVKDFGAVGDGVTDDTAEIQAALNSGAANVLLPKGVYIITAPLVVPIKTTFRGESGGQYSDGSVIKKTTTTSGTGSNLCTTAPGGADSYVKNAILILPHPDNVSNYDTCIEDMRLESDGFIVEYGIYAPRTASLVLKNVAIFQCKYGYYLSRE